LDRQAPRLEPVDDSQLLGSLSVVPASVVGGEDSIKVRTTLLSGEKKMLVWNDLQADEKIKIYDKGVNIQNREGVYDLLVSYRSGDLWVPQVEQTEALKLEMSHFLKCIQDDETPINDGIAGLQVVEMLEAAEKSVKSRGGLVRL
jgi:predicted dehydrogenase